MTSVPLFPFAVFASQARQEFRWRWEPRSDPINWKLADSCDVDSIVQNGDLNSLEFFVQSFLHCNITREDSTHFGSRPALNLFNVMQLAVDYLLQQVHSYSMVALQQTEYAQAVSASFSQLQQKITDQEIQIQRLNSAVQQLKAQNQVCVRQLRKAKRQLRARSERELPIVEFTPEPGFLNLEPRFRPIDVPRAMHSPVSEALRPISAHELSEGEIDPAMVGEELPGIDESGEDSSGAFWPERRG
jgi:hypothetical protein